MIHAQMRQVDVLVVDTSHGEPLPTNFKASFIGGFFVPGVQGTGSVTGLRANSQAFIFTQAIESKGIVALSYHSISMTTL